MAIEAPTHLETTSPRFRAETARSTASHSRLAGSEIGASLAALFAPGAPEAVVLLATVSHDAKTLVAELERALGGRTSIVGCSIQGAFGAEEVVEGGYFAAAMAFGGNELRVATAVARDIDVDTRAKGEAVGREIAERLGREPKALVVFYDPLTGANVERFLDGLAARVACPIVGGGASHDVGPMIRTFQFAGGEVLSRAAVAVALDGPFSAHVDACFGTSPTGIEMEVTRADDNAILMLDDRPALDVWQEISGHGLGPLEYSASLAVGVASSAEGGGPELVRAAFGVDEARGGIVLQASVGEGATVMMHHRTVSKVLDGARDMADRLRSAMAGRRASAVLGFECGARAAPFLGADAVTRENLELRRAVGDDTPWLGMLAWGEIVPIRGRAASVNYAYPVLVFAEPDSADGGGI